MGSRQNSAAPVFAKITGYWDMITPTCFHPVTRSGDVVTDTPLGVQNRQVLLSGPPRKRAFRRQTFRDKDKARDRRSSGTLASARRRSGERRPRQRPEAVSAKDARPG